MAGPDEKNEEHAPEWWFDTSANAEEKEEFECGAKPQAPTPASLLPLEEGNHVASPCSRPSETTKSSPETAANSRVDVAPVGNLSLANVQQMGRSVAVQPVDIVGMVVITRTLQRVRRGRIIPLREAQLLMGRGSRVGCLLEDRDVADYHAVINHEKREGGYGFFVYPIDSHVVEVNGRPIQADIRLSSGDRIRVGNSEMVFFEATLEKEVGI